MQTSEHNWTRAPWRSRWWTPLLWLALGAVMFAAFAIGGRPGDGALGFGVMAVGAAVFALGGRSETLRGLGGPGRDERWAAIDLRATAFAGMVVVSVVLGSWLVELARGEDGSPYGEIAAVGGIAYVAAIVVARLRS